MLLEEAAMLEREGVMYVRVIHPPDHTREVCENVEAEEGSVVGSDDAECLIDNALILFVRVPNQGTADELAERVQKAAGPYAAARC